MTQGGRLLYLLVLAIVCAPVAGAAAAGTALGDLTFAGCVADGGRNGCADASLDALDGARGIAVSPDGKSVYAVSSRGDAIVHFRGAGAGKLSFAGCHADGGRNGCTDVNGLGSPRSVTVSPDGRSVYAVSYESDAIVHFRRDGTGSLSFAGCIADGGRNDCADPALDALDGARDVAVAPDGRSVYAVSSSADAIAHFRRLDDGSLTLASCIADVGRNACADPPLDTLDSVRGVAVSPDGKSVYAASSRGNAIVQLRREGDGNLAFAGCVSDGGINGCVDPRLDALADVRDVAVAPDGRSVYAVSSGASAIAHFRRDGDGSLSFAGCIADGGRNGCADPPLDALGGPRGVAVAPDGRSVYVASHDSDAIAHFLRAGTGDLTFAGCVADRGGNACADPPIDALDGATDLAVAPDGRNVYAVAQLARAVVSFRRASASQRPGPRVVSLVVSPNTFRAAGSANSTGATVLYVLSRPARVRFTVERAKGSGGGYKPLRGSLSRSGGAGSNRFRFSGQLAGRKLEPGRYRLVAVARDSTGRTGKPRRAGFAIVP